MKKKQGKKNEMTISYLIENEVNPDEVPYFELVNNHQELIDFCLSSLIYEDNLINTKINKQIFDCYDSAI